MNNLANADLNNFVGHSIGSRSDASTCLTRLELDKPAHIETSGFFCPANPNDPHAVLQIILDRVERGGKEEFQLREPIGYWDKHLGGIVVPHNLKHFVTDLTSVPQLMTWLVPRTGVHLPAALLHDGLVTGPGEPQTYVADQPISRVEADRILRDAMKDLETSWLSRWLIWTGAAVASKTKKRLPTDQRIIDSIMSVLPNRFACHGPCSHGPFGYDPYFPGLQYWASQPPFSCHPVHWMGWQESGYWISHSDHCLRL